MADGKSRAAAGVKLGSSMAVQKSQWAAWNALSDEEKAKRRAAATPEKKGTPEPEKKGTPERSARAKELLGMRAERQARRKADREGVAQQAASINQKLVDRQIQGNRLNPPKKAGLPSAKLSKEQKRSIVESNLSQALGADIRNAAAQRKRENKSKQLKRQVANKYRPDRPERQRALKAAETKQFAPISR